MLILDRKPHTIEDLDWILQEAIRNGIHTDNHKRQFYNIVCAFDIETTSFNDDVPEEYTDHDVYEYLKGHKIRVTQQAFSDIPDLPLIRRSLFGQLYLSKTEGIFVAGDCRLKRIRQVSTAASDGAVAALAACDYIKDNSL